MQKSEAVQSTTGQKGLINRERPSSVPLQELNGEPVRSNSTGTDNRRPGDGTRASYASGRNFSRGRNSASPFRALETRQGEPAGLTPRPASSSGRINKVQTPVDDPEEIGRAITMDSTGLKRRSRSLSVLFDNDGGANEKLGVENEIRYWRKSYESVNASQVSSVPPDTPGNGNDLETVEETGMDVEAPGPETVQQPAPMFDMSAIKELAGMKITQVANTQTTMLDIERRLAQLEQEVADLSHSQHHLDPGHRQSNEDGSLDRKKRVRRTSPRDLSVDSQRPSRLQNRTLPLRDSDSSSIWYANGQAAAPASGENSASVSRPLSNATIRGVSTRPPSLTRDMNGPFTMDHYATLLALLQTERSAREALEDQVKGLNHQVQSMSRTMEEARLQQGGKTSKLSHLSVFDDYGDDSGDEQDGDRHGDNDGHRTSSAAATATTTRATDKRARPSESTVSSHAVTHSEVEADSSISTFEDDEDSASYYATPYEEDASSGGEERHRDAVKSDRTMSLSQLTMRSPGKMDHDPMPQDGWPRVFV